MGDNTTPALAIDACSDYGSEFDAYALLAASDYGSDIDVDAIDDTLVAVAAADAEPARENQHDDARVPTPERPALRWVQSLPVQPRRVSVELEYDASSRRAFSGMHQRADHGRAEQQTD